MDRIRNARHFAPRLQRWLSGVGALIRASAPATEHDVTQDRRPATRIIRAGFLRGAGAAAAPPSPPRALFKAPPAPPRITLPTPPRSPDAPPLRRIQLGSHALDYELRRSTRRSIGFMIDDDGLRVTAPKRITLAEIDNAIRAKQRWILTKLHERGERRALRQEKPPVQWVDGAELPYMGGDDHPAAAAGRAQPLRVRPGAARTDHRRGAGPVGMAVAGTRADLAAGRSEARVHRTARSVRRAAGRDATAR